MTEEYKLVTEAGEDLKSSVGFEGKGTATYTNGDKYEGSFKAGLRHGENGKYTYNTQGPEDGDKDTYVGGWVDNMKHGIGKQSYWKEGRYNGYWEKGQRHGEGVFIYKNGDIYSGAWAEGKKEGQGTYIFKETGMKYVGSFKAGQMTNGKWLYKNGSCFEGNFDNN